MLNFLRSIGGVLTGMGSLLSQGLSVARAVVPHDVLKMAYEWALVAAEEYADNDTRRAFVIRMLVARGVPESVARLAVELAVQLIKKERGAK